jgi:Fe2+ or Zn2+ uptake regulation protein
LDLDIQSAHAVCRRCGRIAPAAIPPELERGLRLMVAQRPMGWSVDGLSITVMGLCRRCREGPVY